MAPTPAERCGAVSSSRSHRTLPDVPPHSPEAEQATLGAMLLDQEAIPKVRALLQPEDFYLDAHRRIFEAIVELFGRGEAVDLIAITDRLRDKGQLDDVGGAGYVTSLLDSVPTAANVAYHARIVQQNNLQRRAQLTFLEAAQKVASGGGQGVVAEVRRILEELERGAASPSVSVMLTPASEVGIERPAWLWADRTPLGAVTALVGQPGLGKSTQAVEVAACASRGHLPGDLHGKPVAVVIATAEDSPSTTIVPRLIAAGADLTRIHFVQVRRDGISGTILLPDDIPAIRAKLQEVGARLLIVDPLVAHLPGSVNSWRDQDVRRALAPLARLADDLCAAVVVIVHLNKRDSADVLSRVSGSVGIVAAARSVLLAALDPAYPDGPTRVLAHVKSNLGPLAPTLRYRIEGWSIDGPEGKVQTSSVVWMGEAPDVRASELLASQTPEERGEREEAATWLREALAAGPRPAKEVLREARRNGFSEATLLRAKRGLGVRSVKVGFASGSWCWALAEDGQPSPEGHQYSAGDHLRQDASLARASDAGLAEDDHVSDIDQLHGGADHLRRPTSGRPRPTGGRSWRVKLAPPTSERPGVSTGEEEPLATPEDLARAGGRGQFILRIGEGRGWHPYPYAPSLSIAAGKRAWLAFVRINALEELDRAVETMRADPQLDGEVPVLDERREGQPPMGAQGVEADKPSL